jgi:superoxide dismutase
MDETINKIFENSKQAYKKSILLGNEELEELLFLILTDSKKLLDEVENKKTAKSSSTTMERTEDEEIKRVKRKIPLWFSKPEQYNHKILITYLKLSNKNQNPVGLLDLEQQSGFSDKHKFTTNFNQMKTLSYKNHGKVFTEDNGIVILWEPLADFIVEEYKKIEEL